MIKLFNFIQAVYMWGFFVVVIILRLFRLISHDRFLTLLFAEDKAQFSNEDVSFKKIYKNLQ